MASRPELTALAVNGSRSPLRGHVSGGYADCGFSDQC
jgi:hypothetical protein